MSLEAHLLVLRIAGGNIGKEHLLQFQRVGGWKGLAGFKCWLRLEGARGCGGAANTTREDRGVQWVCFTKGVRRCLPMLREKSEGASRYGEEKRQLTVRDTREADANFLD